MRFSLAASVCVLVLVGCDGGPDYARYPAPLDLPAVSVSDLGTAAPIPGRYNVTATVVEVTECSCPDNAMCAPCQFLDGVVVSEVGEPLDSPSGAGHLHVAAEDPEQFEVGRQYVLSVDVEGAYPADRPLYRSVLLGYGLAK